MKIEKIKGKNPVADFFAAPLSVEGEADLHHLQFADALAEMMKEQKISKVELARRMGVQPSHVTAMLSANGNFTIRTMIRAARAVKANIKTIPLRIPKIQKHLRCLTTTIAPQPKQHYHA